MAEGVVKWFNSEKGYGFVTPDGGGPDVFVHYSSIEMTGYRCLDEGERVSFTFEQGLKGPQATHVLPLPFAVPAPRSEDWNLTRLWGGVDDPWVGYSLTRVSRKRARKIHMTFEGMLHGRPWSEGVTPPTRTLRRNQRTVIRMDEDLQETVTRVTVRWRSGLRTRTWQTTNV